MRIIYLSSVCAQNRFDELVSEGYIVSQFQNQKFHHLMLKGLRETVTSDISVISFYPAVRKYKVNYSYEEEIEDGIKYIYPSYKKKFLFDTPTRIIHSYKQIHKLDNKESVIVCNIMNFQMCLAAIIYRFFHKIKICAIVADVPGKTSNASNDIKQKQSFFRRFISKVTTKIEESVYFSLNPKYDGYLFLTEAMNGVVNTRNKPYVVVEGLSDLSMSIVSNNVEDKYQNKTILYAGGLHKEYGIDLLVNAFMKIVGDNIELHIYGKGNYVDEIIKASNIDKRIKYFGVKDNREIVNAQTKAHILVNPRPTNAEFVKYSFPSKIMECMASGTPLLTTKIPGIPSDYYPYLFFINEESEKGVLNALKDLLALPVNVLHEKGLLAKEFILVNRNYKIQANKLYTLLNQISG